MSWNGCRNRIWVREMADKVRFTNEQQKVIDLRGRNILVSAAAGSGKTAVLVERIIRLITDPEDPVDVDRLLVVTFTRAAAAQMKDKISDAILKRLDEAPDDLNLQRQAALIHNSHITTIDSFCQYVLRNCVTDADIDPATRIAEEGENLLLEADVLDEMIEELYADGDADFLYMVSHIVTGSDDVGLSDSISSLYSEAMSAPWPEVWLDEHSRDYRITDGRLPDRVGIFLEKSITDLIRGSCAAYENAYRDASKAGLCADNVNMIKNEYDSINGILTQINEDGFDYDRVRDAVSAVVFPTFSRKKGDSEDHDIRQRAKAYRDRGKAFIIELRDEWLTYSYVNLISHVAACDRVVKTLCRITRRYIDRVASVKSEKKLMSFADCEHRALDVLVRRGEDGKPVSTEAAVAFRDYFRYVFIDEYQDSNLIQEYILSAVSGEEDGVYNRFMVGDVKQSIYRFRQAEPRIFTEKYSEYGYDDPIREKVDLNMNFRSRREVLASANALFERVMTPEEGGSDYNEAASLKVGADYPAVDGCDYTTELLFVDSGAASEDESDEDDATDFTDKAHLEGLAISQRIRELMEEPFYVRDEASPGRIRRIRYSDIVILYRSSVEYASVYKESLEESGIPAHLSGTTGYFATYEIQNLLNYLRIIVNPLQDIYFYGVMEGVFGGFTQEEIARISLAYRESLPDGVSPGEGYLNAACRMPIEDPQLESRKKRFINRLDSYREMSVYLQADGLLSRIIEDYDYITRINAMKGGDRREANVDMLLRKAAEYAETSYFGLYNFLRYLDNLKKSKSFDSEAEMNAENADVVRIMTTHKSKGLEFPVCIVARMGNELNMQDARGKLIIDHNTGIGIKDIDIDNRLSYDNIMHKYVADTVIRETVSEEMRILYVAMTRAMEKLILVCADAGKSDPENADSYILKRPGKKRKYINWHLDCICNELESEEFAVGKSFVNLPGMHIKMKLCDLKSAQIKEMDAAEYLSHKLKLEHLKGASEALPEDDIYISFLDSLYDLDYPHPDLSGLYSKTSVSELKASAIIEDNEPVREMFEKRRRIPQFISGRPDKAGATVRGSAFHRIMELFDFGLIEDSEVMSTRDVEEFLDRMLTDHRITSYERDIFKDRGELGRLMRFLSSETARRMQKASAKGKLFREAPFMMGIGADLIDVRYPHDETVLIQGIIDAWWQEDGGAVILDYKTDRVESADKLTQLYSKQLELYEQALISMHITVKEKIIYSFELGETITI